jgi:hypothetical protein
MNASPPPKHNIHAIACMSVGALFVLSRFIDFPALGYGVFKSVACMLVPCNTELPEIGASASNDRFLGGLYRSQGQIRYEGKEISTSHRVRTRACEIPDDRGNGRRYICASNEGAVFDIAYTDAIPGLLLITVYSHGNSRVEKLWFKSQH